MHPDTPIEVPRAELAPGYSIPRIVNGTWQLSRDHREGAVDPGIAVGELRRLAEAGLDTFDCGDIYVGVETLLGKLRSEVGEIRIHTKFVPDRNELSRLDRRYVERIVDRSLQRLGVERLDLVQFAWWDYDVPRYVETALWLDELRRAGKIRLLGATNFDVPHLARIVEAGVPIRSHQVQYSLLDRRPERGMARYCREQGIRLLAYGSLGGGYLSERYLGRRRDEAGPLNRSLIKYRLIIDELSGWDRFQELLATLARIASRHDVGMGNVAVRWVLDRTGVAAAIVGAYDARHLDQNLKTFSLTLDERDHAELAGFAEAGPDGDVYAAERVPGGPHAAIMRYNLNRED